ncbi:hypothetical protein ASPZODRAFT_139466 [Penicilliopsis zonata CBS 506.65]|uniref:Uncharacterized protein n=1 Tax=Penicilliopsis zonata CBS 506.65 TaxID=1073090 RepID=A0A1L9SSG2_9EURO|nr:hypothetical protein ASPZODRAFT_139466 [Penicilliopsis zonata CBS 506.65]OJJ50145.1 hypothetical protein ASPZODRAFT_139466 [Penicilliopsis zonata CBS 506.65]
MAVAWNCPVLKLSHHGSRGSTPLDLLEKVNPERCVWHTDPEVLERLHDHYAATGDEAENHRSGGNLRSRGLPKELSQYMERLVNLWFRIVENHMPIVGFPPKPGQYVRVPSNLAVYFFSFQRIATSIPDKAIKNAKEKASKEWREACGVEPDVLERSRQAYHSASLNEIPIEELGEERLRKKYAQAVFREMLQQFMIKHFVDDSDHPSWPTF